MKDFFNSFAQKYSLLFQEGLQGPWSMMRYIVWFIITDVMLVWSWVSLKNGRVEDIPMGVVTVVLAAIGGKVIQKNAEPSSADEKTNE